MSFMSFISEWAPKWPFPAATVPAPKQQPEKFAVFVHLLPGDGTRYRCDLGVTCFREGAGVELLRLREENAVRGQKGAPATGWMAVELVPAALRYRELPEVWSVPDLIGSFPLYGDLKEVFEGLGKFDV